MNRTLIAFAFLLSCSLPVQAAPILPGLWEFTSRDIQVCHKAVR